MYTGTHKLPPAGAEEMIRAGAADGWSKTGIARKLGVSAEVLLAWFENHPELKTAFDDGREEEHHQLWNVLFRQATEKDNTTAAIFLLKGRHGYRDFGPQDDPGNKINITFALPGALPMESYRKAIENGQAKKTT